MNTIKRDVYVLKNTIKIPIEVTKGTDAITFEFTVRDYNLPATAAAVAYAYRMGMKKPNSTLCDVSGNVISFQPSANFFEVGNNELQIRVINGDKSLISFKEKVKCSDSMGFPDEEEEVDQSLIEQIIAQSGKESGERKAADAQERTERIEADTREKSERLKEIATERARIDQLTKKGEGSTTGDAELADIRVGNEGATYSNAGNAVRSQTKDVPAMMDNLQSPYVDISLLEQGSLNNTGTEITSSKVLRSVKFHWNKNGKITAPSGYKIAIANYAMQSDESGQMLQVYQSATDYGDSQTSSKADGDTEFRRLLIKRSDGADINAEDLRGKIATNVPGLRPMDVIENIVNNVKVTFYGILVRGNMKVSLEDNSVVTVTFSDDARLQTRNGTTIHVTSGTVTLKSPKSNNIICYNNVTNAIVNYIHSDVDVCKPEITCLFNVYNGLVYECNIPLHYDGTYINTTQLSYAKTIGVDNFTITPTSDGYKISSSNYLIDSYGNLHSIDNNVINFTVNETVLNLLCFNRENKTFVNLPYSSTDLTKMPYDVVCGFYKNDVVNFLSNVINTNTTVADLRNSCVIKGNIFARISGKYAIVSCTPYARALIHNTNINISGFTLKKELNTVTIKYLILDEKGFDCVDASSLPENATIIALYYQYSVIPLNIGVICNTLPISEITQRKDIPFHLTWDRLGYRITSSTFNQNTDNYVIGNGWLTVKNGYELSQDLSIIDEYGKPNKIDVTITQNTNSIANKKILMIGDSITNRGWLQQYISERATVDFVGTKQTGDGKGIKDYMCEGYPGKTSTWMCGENSPFWNPNTNMFDFHYYSTTHNIEPDIVTIEFGLNERIYGDKFVENIQLMIDSIHAHNKDIRVYVITPFRMRKGGHDNTYGIDEKSYTYNMSCMLSCETLTECTLIPVWFILNDMYDYDTVNANYGYGNITYESARDPIHPSKEIGFKKLADMIYSYLM